MDVVNVILQPVVESLMVPVKRHIDFMTSCKKYVTDMEVSMRELNDIKNDDENNVKHNKRENLEIPTHVPGWLEEVEKVNAKVNIISSNVGSCLNFKTRHGVGKKAFELIGDIKRLLDERSRIVWANHPIPLGEVDSMTASTSSSSVDFESREQTFMKALKALEPDHKSHMIALCGMGGVGKSTMMEKLKTVVKEKRIFNLIVMVVIGEKTDPFAIQDAVADYLGIDLKKKTISARADKLRGWFTNYSDGGKKKILVILDDIWKLVNLGDIGLSALPNQGVDFKVLLTSRSRDVCTKMGVKANSVCNVDLLENAEAQRFFWKFAKDSGQADLGPDFRNAGYEIVSRCQGLPLAIKTIANTLKGKSKGMWEDTLTRLQHHDIGKTLNEIFEVSYNNLEDEETKSVFLLCGLYPEDFNIPIEELVRYKWGLKLFDEMDTINTARNRVNACIEQLVNANLLIESNHAGSIKMHDLVRSFVLKMYSEAKQGNMLRWSANDEPDSCKIISLACKGMEEFPTDFINQNPSFLKLTHVDGSIRFPKNFYELMKNLQVIVYEKMQYPLLPGSLEYSTNLRTLCLHGCSLSFDCHSIGSLSNLEVLSFSNCSIHELPSTVGNLKELKLLDVTGCFNLHFDDGVLKNLFKLKEVYMRGAHRKAISFIDKKFNEFAERSKNLSAIEFEFFGNGVHPKRISFINLERFKISIGRLLEKKSEITTSFENTLMLVSDKFDLLESGINVLFEKTVVLHLKVFGMKRLEDLKCSSFHRLRVLNISRCQPLRYLFTRNVAFTLSTLEHLKVKSCYTLETLIHDEDSGSERIRFPSLKFLSLDDLPNLVGLCNTGSVIELPKITEIIVEECRSIKYLLSSQMFKFLKIVNIDNCQVMKEIVSNRYDEDEEMTTSTSTHKNVTCFPILEILRLSYLPSLQHIGGGSRNQFQWSLCQYSRHILINDCNALSSAIPSYALGHMQHLENLDLMCCDSMKDVFEMKRVGPVNDVRGSSSCRAGEGSGAGDNNNNTSSSVVVSSLTTNTTTITILPDFRNLRSLDIYECHLLRDVIPFSILKSLTKLESLEIKYCNNIRVIVKEEEEDGNHISSSSDHQVLEVVFPCLKSLILDDLPSLESFFSGTNAFRCPVLDSVKIWRCPKMRMFTKGHSETPMLKYVVSDMEENSDVECLQKVTRILLCSKMRMFTKGRSDSPTLKYLRSDNYLQEEPQEEEEAVALSSLCLHSRCITINDCRELSSAIPSYVLGHMQHLEELRIYCCYSMKDVFEMKRVVVNDVIRSSGCRPGEGSSVGDNNTSSSDVSLLTNTTILPDLRNLRRLKIHGCPLLRDVFPFSVLQSLTKLESLKIRYCKDIRVIVKEEEEDGNHTTTSSSSHDQVLVVVFPCLKSVELSYLDNLESFFLGRNAFRWPVLDRVEIKRCPKMRMFTKVHSDTPMLKYVVSDVGENSVVECGKINHLFHEEVPCPSLDGSTSLPLSQRRMSWFYNNLINVQVSKRNNQRYIIGHNELQHMLKIEKLKISWCEGAKEIFETFEMNNGLNQTHPVLEVREMEFLWLSSIKCLWKTKQWTVLKFPNLTRLSIGHCDSLKHVFTISMVGSLLQLQELKIIDCPKMEMILADVEEKDEEDKEDEDDEEKEDEEDEEDEEEKEENNNGKEDEGDDERRANEDHKKEEKEHDDERRVNGVVFPCLRNLTLHDLGSLKGFCLEMVTIHWPSLDTLEIEKCPEITTFTNGQSTTPELKLIETSFGLCDATEDVNSFIRTKIEEGYNFGEAEET